MTDGSTNFESEAKPAIAHHYSVGTWMVVTVLLLLLIASVAIGYFGWTISDNNVPTSGYVAMALGVIFSVVVGVGLMTLVFYSSRAGYDEPATLIAEPHLDQDGTQGSHEPQG